MYHTHCDCSACTGPADFPQQTPHETKGNYLCSLKKPASNRIITADPLESSHFLKAVSTALHIFADKGQEQGRDGGADLAAGVGAAGPVDADLLGNIQLLLQLLSDRHRAILGLNDRHPAVLQQAAALSGRDPAEKDTSLWRIADCSYPCSSTCVQGAAPLSCLCVPTKAPQQDTGRQCRGLAPRLHVPRPRKEGVGRAGALTCAPVQDTRPRSRLPGSILYFWKIGSFRSSCTLSLGMKGNRTSCSTVSRTVPSPYLQQTALSQQET